MNSFFARVIGSCGGLGFVPAAPGTVTSFAAALVYLFVPALGRIEVMVPLLVVVFLLGLWASGEMEKIYGHDPSQVTVDELAGQWIALLLLPHDWLVALLGFAAFRLFDIVKPEPVDSAQRLPGAWGVMVDDVLAGVYANLSVRIVLWLLPYVSVAVPLQN
ncbi:phosphatidylglycerophosphatase A [Prosthecochloris sp. N3]|uniref:Phosphatidylglycerophosphatase A n=1 Tax=Prosthecochloris ethylica TaxID=2743976 RepID=A0ABR9XV40_9CHLB|nr:MULTISPECIES: phosphatidylglycerophosphatase A [Prosthecochloris]MBF0587448.1 phosphatidylglycerophosphatase A [Prosthecochloris ethylica]MBF0637712.1 phosphatidylglycerophosphatase A [Prosthecochloris ethylica]NUK48677.1 phosphatidylglycerophosphatase A [Prosthecochloris ethylica]RNA64530.1 phosphatidylglycerophosphatase A [Prosthecochloris sp. ZM_2]